MLHTTTAAFVPCSHFSKRAGPEALTLLADRRPCDHEPGLLGAHVGPAVAQFRPAGIPEGALAVGRDRRWHRCRRAPSQRSFLSTAQPRFERRGNDGAGPASRW